MSNNNSSLRPGWYKGSGVGGGKGFQPPPTASDRGDKGRSNSMESETEGRRDSNKFAALLDDDDGAGDGNGNGNGVVHAAESSSKPPPVVSSARSEAFRSSFNRTSSTGSKIGVSGRSLADLAARAPESASGGHRRHSAYDGPKGGIGGSGSSSGNARFPNLHSGDGMPGGSIESSKADPKVVRYTREKLLALRPRDDAGPPGELKLLEGAIVISSTTQDPVCWDNLDAEEIWEMAREQRRTSVISSGGKPTGVGPEVDPRRRNISSGGRWQRGVALPPPEDGNRRNADNPNELWDDPTGGVMGAASDFSSFGALPSEDNDQTFDFDKMTKASAKLEKELHGGESQDSDDESDQQNKKKVDVSRPLASAGTTLLTGCGNDVSVFEDFDTPATSDVEGSDLSSKSTKSKDDKEIPTVRGGDEDPSASSMLMKMIGVSRDTSADETSKDTVPTQQPNSNPWGSSMGIDPSNTTSAIDPIMGAIGAGPSNTGASISLNPWGDPIAQSSTSQPLPGGGGGMNLGIHLSSFSAEQKNREALIASERENVARREAELLRRQQEEEEKQRCALAQQQEEERARQQQSAMQQQEQQQQQASSQQSQIELVLMERICTILENSWGRADLVTILTTLHSEDSRVIPLLSNVESIRALIARSPQRVSIRRDSGLGDEMAVLVLTNEQWQEQKQHQARIEQEELLRRQMEEEEKARMEAQNRLIVSMKQDDPWYYSDPQNNIQGPFRGEEMRQWLEAGYFKGDLPISQIPSGPFHQLCTWFPDLDSAFRVPTQEGQDGSSEDTEVRLRKEAEAAIATERKRIAQEVAVAAQKEAEEKADAAARKLERLELEKVRNANVAEMQQTPTNSGNQSSTQLKMMLGLTSGEQPIVDKQIVEDTAGAKKASKNQRNADDNLSKVASKKSSQKTINRSQAAPKLETNVQPIPSDPISSTPATSAWGGAKNNKPRKSMSEIQQEEACAAAILTTKRGSMGQSGSSGWANVAAGSTGWSSGAIRPSSTQNVAAVTSMRPAQGSLKSQPNGQSGASRKVTSNTQNQRAVPAPFSTPAEEFGTTMSPALEKWCKEKMQQINGSDDLTLVAFCMTLNDANEIRQYLTTYLGLTPQVNNFATEFINKRGLGSKQEEWETPGSAKKGRKKKSGR